MTTKQVKCDQCDETVTLTKIVFDQGDVWKGECPNGHVTTQ